MVGRSSRIIVLSVLFACHSARAILPDPEENIGESNRDESVLESSEWPINLLTADEEALFRSTLLREAQTAQWIGLRAKYEGNSWTWTAIADSLQLTAAQLGQLRDNAVLGESVSERSQIRLTAQGEDGDNITMWSGKLRARHSVGKQWRSEVVAVRRPTDPQVIDDVHVTLSGRIQAWDVTYVAGTYQFDWGLGLLSSQGFGTARAFSSVTSNAASFGSGIAARIPTSEYSWYRGAAIEYGRELKVLVGINAREWNGAGTADGARLTGTFSANDGETAITRDFVDEQGGFAGLRYERNGVRAGALVEREVYDPQPMGANGSVFGESVFGGYDWNGAAIHAEVARSGGGEAWCAVVSRGTERFLWALYSQHGSEGYSPLRGQGWRTYGEALNDATRRGMRAGWYDEAYRMHLEIRDEKDADISRGEAELRFGINWAGGGDLEIRALAGTRDTEDDAGRSYERIRMAASWDDVLVWSTRAEIRQSRARGGGDPQHGSYVYAQAEKKLGSLRGGLRLTRFELPSSESPALVYEHDLSGAYPLQHLSGSGSRFSAWLGLSYQTIRMAFKASSVYRSGADATAEFGVEATFAH